LTSFHYLEDVVDEKAKADDLKRLLSDFNKHVLDFDDLRTRFQGTA